MNNFEFKIISRDKNSNARNSLFQTPHGLIETPIFMPVGTQASVKSLSPLELEESRALIILANTYHLHLRPGENLVMEAGGLHEFTGWKRAFLTDSGGYQVFSLRDISKITDEGVRFKSHLDGSTHFFSPESVMETEHKLGADIIMMFDECPPADETPEKIETAVDRTIRWAYRCFDAHNSVPFHFGYPQALFPVIQGGTVKSLREKCCYEMSKMDLPGYAVGGCAVGEKIEKTYEIAGFTAERLPVNRPRYLMGVGKPEDIIECVSRGIDMFDCVLPTRNGRNGSAFTWHGKLNIRNAAHKKDFHNSIDNDCACYACRNFSRGYLRHLYMAGEILAIRMLTLHNIHFFLELTNEIKNQIKNGTFPEWKEKTLLKIRKKPEPCI